MLEEQVKRGLRLVRYGGLVVTVIVFVVLFVFTLLVGNAFASSGMALSSFLPYIVGFTVFAAVLSVIIYFAYRAYLMGRVKKA